MIHPIPDGLLASHASGEWAKSHAMPSRLAPTVRAIFPTLRRPPMKIVNVSAIPMSAPVPPEKRHRTDLGTKVKSDATLIRVGTDDGLTGIGAALGSPPIVAAI